MKSNIVSKTSNLRRPPNMREATATGFTIVELLIVIVVIGILAAIVVVAFNGVQDRARTTSRDADISQYYKAITAARIQDGVALRYITGSAYSMGSCNSAANNAGATEPKDLPKSHACWVRYYENLDRIGAAAGMNLNDLRDGDSRGNPYMLDENEGENCNPDRLYTYTGTGVNTLMVKLVPRLNDAC